MDQKETVYSKTLTTTLHAPTICRIEGSEFTKVTADDLKLVITGAEFVSERVVSYVLAKLEAHFKCNSILVSPSTQVLNDQRITHFLEKAYGKDDKRSIAEQLLDSRFDDDEVSRTVYESIAGEFSDDILQRFFSQSTTSMFLFFPVFVHGNHWILFVASSRMRRIFIIDSLPRISLADSEDSYLSYLLLKYFEYKSHQGPGFVFNRSDWQTVTLPSARQPGDSNACAFYVMINAAKIMRQVAENVDVELSSVEERLFVYNSADCKEIRKRVHNTLFGRESFESLAEYLLSNTRVVTTQAVKSPKKPSKSPKKSLKKKS